MEKLPVIARGFLLSLGMSLGFALFLVAQAALTSGLSVSDKSSTGATLSSASWNRIVDSVLELDTRTVNLASSKQNSLPGGTSGQVLKWNGSAWVAGTDSTSAALGQNSCEWIYVTTCGHVCWQWNVYAATCPAGKYQAGIGYNTWDQYSHYNFKIYCCAP